MATALTDTTEAELVSKAQQGDLEAFEEIILRYRAGAINVAYRMCGDAAIAEDAAQAAFIKAWQRLQDYRPTGSFRSWLYRIAVNAALDILRQEKHLASRENRLESRGNRLADLERVPASSTEQDPGALIEIKERRELVRKAILALPAASRAALVLREYEGLSYKEIAQALDIPVGTVMSRLNYARDRLSEMLSPILGTAQRQMDLHEKFPDRSGNCVANERVRLDLEEA
ncbi:MAG: sigma-70 family RNA polymerase sigma factor [Anaerolineales bacterium]|nr:sigma-70 family RNA polymerase sigma factor [Anaerolineales bacterium]